MNNFNQSDFWTYDRFWEIDPETGGCSISIWEFMSFLVRHGFGKVYPNGAKQCVFVRVQKNVIEEVSPVFIKDFVTDYLLRCEPSILDIITHHSTRFFSKEKLEFLPEIELNLCRDTKDTCWLYYRNGAVRITQNEKELALHPYSILPGLVWKSNIIDRDFNASAEPPVIARFIKNICDANRQRIRALVSAVCYLIHLYKDPSNAKIVSLFDQDIEDHNGGTGKGLIVKVVAAFRRVLTVDGRTRAQNQFIFQGMNHDVNVLHIEDVRNDFDIGRLFNVITGNFEVENKGRDRFSIPFEDSPKLVLSSNFVFEGSDPSHRRRLAEYELFNYYDHTFSPEDEFGHLFFVDWDEDEWARFDSWLCRMMIDYLKHGLITVDPINLQFKRLVSVTCRSFAEWLRDEFELKIGEWYAKGDLADLFNASVEECKDTRTIMKWFKAAANMLNLEVEEESHRIRGKIIRVIRFVPKKQRRPEHPKGPDMGSGRYLL